jgi:glycine/D-amino acid oxidase-like deaminating enzyme
MRIAVIGAGIVGTQVALELTRRGAEVRLADRGEPGAGTTAGSFAWIDASHPGIADYLELRLLGVAGWRRQAAELGHPPWLTLSGTTLWTRDPEEAAAFERHVQRLEEHGQRPQRLSPASALEREPALVLAPELEVVYRFPGEGWVKTGPAVAALLERGRRAGLELLAAEAQELIVDGSGRVGGVVVGGGRRLPCDAVVACAGRWTESLLAPSGVEVTMLSPGDTRGQVPGLVVQTTPVAGRVAGVILADGLMMRPDRGGRLLLHSDAHDAGVSGDSIDPRIADALLTLLRGRLRGTEHARVQTARICLRAIPGDLLPVAGWAADGLYVIATHSGVTLAPALAQLVASELIDEQERPELARFRPSRFRSLTA